MDLLTQEEVCQDKGLSLATWTQLVTMLNSGCPLVDQKLPSLTTRTKALEYWTLLTQALVQVRAVYVNVFLYINVYWSQ